MQSILFILLILVCSAPGIIFCDESNSNDSENATSSEEGDVLINLPEYVQVVEVDAVDYIKSDKTKHVMMGISDEKCDNASYNLLTDFDPYNQTLVELNTKCFEANTYKVNDTRGPILTVMKTPKRYMPIHRCMIYQIRYSERIPLIGPHRPLWARYGEYQYLPPQRWLHNIEHGAIIALYHPCADPEQVKQLKELVKSCLFRHVITPFTNLTSEHPIALLGWSASLEMSRLDYDLAKTFMKFYARNGPERMFRNGQYKHLIIEDAKVVTNVIDSDICPDK